jgi:hypothetical protein
LLILDSELIETHGSISRSIFYFYSTQTSSTLRSMSRKALPSPTSFSMINLFFRCIILPACHDDHNVIILCAPPRLSLTLVTRSVCRPYEPFLNTAPPLCVLTAVLVSVSHILLYLHSLFQGLTHCPLS